MRPRAVGPLLAVKALKAEVRQTPDNCDHCNFAPEWREADMQQIEHHAEVTINWKIPTAMLLAFLLHNLEEALTFSANR